MMIRIVSVVAALAVALTLPADPPPPPPTPVSGGQPYDQWPCGASVEPGINSPLPRLRFKPCDPPPAAAP